MERDKGIIIGKVLEVVKDGYYKGCVKCISIDKATGNTLADHTSSSEGYAKQDLGFEKYLHLSWAYHERRELYDKLYPNGWTWEWEGL